MTFNDDAIAEEGLRDFFTNLCKNGPNVSKRWQKLNEEPKLSHEDYSKSC